MEEFFKIVPREFFDFSVVALFSLIIGLSQKKLQASHTTHTDSSFGTDRTFAFIGIAGFIFWIIDPSRTIYVVGMVVLAFLLAINYYQKISLFKDFGFTSVFIALITYTLAALIRTQPFWLFLLVYVTMLVLTELKESLNSFSQKVNREEFIILGKFLAIAGIVLPMVPNTPVVSFSDITPYKVWLAVVVISSISYFSYLLRKFVFKDAGILLTGALGGLYSSTATTIVLARSSRNAGGNYNHYTAGIVLATVMMYIRVAVLLAIFNMGLFMQLYVWFLIMVAVSLLVVILMMTIRQEKPLVETSTLQANVNPLEFRIAVIFTLLYVAFSFITHFTLQEFGTAGLQALAYIVGVADIDPFLLNLFQGKMVADTTIIAAATFQAIISNNILKSIYGFTLAHRKCRYLLLLGMGSIIIVNLILVMVL